MKTLVIETSHEGYLAAIKDKTILQAATLPAGPALSKDLALEIEKLSAFAPFDQIILGAGPGSFTGIRVGASMAQALAFGWDIPLKTASSLTAYAPDKQNFAVALDARSGGIYVQIQFNPPKLLSPSEAEKLLNTIPLICSPDPAPLLVRMPTLTIEKTTPNPFLLIEHSIPVPKNTPPKLFYLTTP